MEALGSAISKFLDHHLIITLFSIVAAAIEFLIIPSNSLKSFNIYFYLLVLFAISFLIFTGIKEVINMIQGYRNHRYLVKKHTENQIEEEDRAAREAITDNNSLTSKQKQFIFKQILNDNHVVKMDAGDFYSLRNQRLGGSLRNDFVKMIKEQITTDCIKVKLDERWHHNILILLSRYEKISDFDEEEENLDIVVDYAKNKMQVESF